ncbi:MAG: amidohydrolase family protein [Pseudomonadota bacterium]
MSHVRHRYRLAARSVIAVVTALIIGCSAPNPTLPALAITNVTVIDAAHGVRQSQTVVVDGERIIAVSNRTVPAQRTIDGSGKFLIPGLWDMHVHLTYEPALVETMPAMFVAFGVTSVRETGGKLDALLPVVQRMRAPDAVAPRVFFSGPLMDGTPVIYNGVNVPEIGIANQTVATAKRNVALLHAAGADFIKIYELVSPDVFRAIAQAAAEHNMPVAAHVPLSMQASEVGQHVHSLEHLRNIELDCAADADALLTARREMLKNPDAMTGLALRGSLHRAQRSDAIEALDSERCDRVLAALADVIQVPTAQLNSLGRWPSWERADWTEAVKVLPAELQGAWAIPPFWYQPDPDGAFARFGTFSQAMIALMHAKGIAIGAGTDTPIARAIPGDSLHSELEVLVAAGLSPIEALRAATLTPARFFNLEDEMGQIAVGHQADLVLLNRNPLDNIRHTRDIDRVILRGRDIDTNESASLATQRER